MLAFPKIEWYNMNEHKYLPLTYQEGGRKVSDCKTEPSGNRNDLIPNFIPAKIPCMIRMDTDVQASELIKKYMKRANHPKGWDAKQGA